jgi:hypothetical protein
MENFFDNILPILITFGIPILIGILSTKKKKRKPVASADNFDFSLNSSENNTDQEIENIFSKQEEALEDQKQTKDKKEMSVQEVKEKLEQEWEEKNQKKESEIKQDPDEKKENDVDERKEEKEEEEDNTILENYEEGEQMTDSNYSQYYPTKESKKKDVISKIKEDFDLEEGIIYSEILNRKHF